MIWLTLDDTVLENRTRTDRDLRPRFGFLRKILADTALQLHKTAFEEDFHNLE
jgi:hypothetical protein